MHAFLPLVMFVTFLAFDVACVQCICTCDWSIISCLVCGDAFLVRLILATFNHSVDVLYM